MLERRKYSLTQANFNILKFSDFIDSKELKEARDIVEKTDYDKIRHYKIDDISIGEHAYAGALRYHARGELDYSEDDVLILKNIFFCVKNLFYI